MDLRSRMVLEILRYWELITEASPRINAIRSRWDYQLGWDRVSGDVPDIVDEVICWVI